MDTLSDIQKKMEALKELSEDELNRRIEEAITLERSRAHVMTRSEREEQMIGFIWGQLMEGPPRTRESIRKNLGLWPPQ